MTDKTLGACQCHEKHAPTYWKGVVREYKDALEKAVRERDEALADAESRPLTPDAITDEMIERGRSAYWGPAFGGSVEERVLAILTAALTEPTRPEGLTALIDTIREATYDPEPVATGEALYSAGVRVVSEDGAR